ncbi:hypothetical protein [Streptomyces sp. cg35]|uniref:hypothetical protein n=1 Tax=Streptomyces sp. cg35 TaxID=3421650 RepID=UPI003D1858D8
MGSDFAIVAHEAVDGIFDAATHRDGPTLVVSTEGRMDREAFLGAVRESLPLEPPLESSLSWDALSDSLRAGLHTLRVLSPGVCRTSNRCTDVM